MTKGRFIAVANMKGGVGKTTTVVTLAESLLAEDPARRVLIADLDPQGSASVTVAGDEALYRIIREGLTLQDFLESRLVDNDREARLMRHVHAALNNTQHLNRRLDVNLLPCGPQLRTIEKRIIYETARVHGGYDAYEGKLQRLFDRDFLPLRERYDYVVFDCPPGISALAEIAIRSSDVVLMPTIPDRISVLGLKAFIESVWNVRTAKPRAFSQPYVLITRTQPVKQHREMVAALVELSGAPDCSYRLIRTRVPQLASFARALDVDHDAPASFRSRYPDDMLATMRDLTREVREACHGV